MLAKNNLNIRTLIVFEEENVEAKVLILNWFKRWCVTTKVLSPEQIITGHVGKVSTLKRKIKKQYNVNVEVIKFDSKENVKATTSEEVVKELGLKLRV